MPEEKYGPDAEMVEMIVETFKETCGDDSTDRFRPFLSPSLADAMLIRFVWDYVVIRSEHHPEDPIGPFVQTYFEASRALKIFDDDHYDHDCDG